MRLTPPIVGAVCLASLTLVAGCPPVADQDLPGADHELTFAFWALEAREVALVNELVDQFETEHPGLTVDVADIPARYYEKLLTLFAADHPPDVFVANYGRLGDFARRGLAADLSGRLAADPGLQPADFVPVAYETFAALGDTLGRPGLYGLPRDWGPAGLLVYDTEAFDAAGLAYPSDGWTWGDFADACRRLTIRRNGEVVRYGGSLNLYPYSLLGWIRQNGGEVVSPDGTRSLLGSPASVEAVQFLAELNASGNILPADPASDESLEAFLQGQVAMAFVTPYALCRLRESRTVRWRIASPLVGKQRATGCIPSAVAVSSACGDQASAYALAHFLATEGARRLAAAGLVVPAYRPALQSTALEEGIGHQAAAVIRGAAPYARPYPVSTEVPYEEALASLRAALDEIFVLNHDASAALAAADARLAGPVAGR